MDQNIRKSYLKKVKADTWAIELIILGALSYVAYLTFESLGYGILNMGCSMPFYNDPVYNSKPDQIIYIKEVCLINIFWKIIPFILLPALLLSAALLSSSKQASLGMRIEGLYLVNKKGERPEFIESLRFVAINKSLIFIYLIYSGFLLSGFTLTLHEIFNLIIVISAFALFLDIWDWYHPSDQVWEERISKCQYKFTEKGQEGFDKHVKRTDKKHWRLFYKLAASQTGSIIYFLILAFMAFNVLREGTPPKDYNEIVYKHPAIMWKDNSYFALAGLNAPVNIDDFYEYGRQKAIFHSKFFTDYKATIGIPFIQPVPETKLTLYDPATTGEQIEFQDKEMVEAAECLYDIRIRKEATTECPSMDSVLPVAIKKIWCYGNASTKCRTMRIFPCRI